MKYPKNFRASLRSAQFLQVRPPPNLKSWIRQCKLCPSIRNTWQDYHIQNIESKIVELLMVIKSYCKQNGKS
jgi:hypothetical protein